MTDADDHWQVEDTEELWKREGGRQGWGGAGGYQGDSAGQVCAAVLVKLVMDMYLKATPAVAFPLTLVMLHRWAGAILNTPLLSMPEANLHIVKAHKLMSKPRLHLLVVGGPSASF